MSSQSHRSLEMWAGVECTVNRVGDSFFDQLESSGHANRLEDLERFIALGIKALRYPVLWERTQPVDGGQIDWSWSDVRLDVLRRACVRPIVGLVHHGSGPKHTNLLDPAFSAGLAAYAVQVARRYPWVDAYTPVNEPLTTARFSALYGHWYPHACDPKFFTQALLNQCRATVLAMRSIRQIQPAAQLVQTDDLGKTYSTQRLAYQADFENERRWITWDLLNGRVDRTHPLWSFFMWAGTSEAEVAWFLDNPCPPDVIGLNYYITSERFLDERRERYPSFTHGGNGREAYADVEAVRVLDEGVMGAGRLLREAWQRYGLPLAITEAHLGCTREEQLRWLAETWDAAQAEREHGADVRAVTAWSLIGAYDWNSLLTRCNGHYESGVFDLRSPSPRSTALARLVRCFAEGRRPNLPVLDSPGWWRRTTRISYPPVPSNCVGSAPTFVRSNRKHRPVPCSPRPLVITGAHGKLGVAFIRLCEERGLAYLGSTRREMDIANREAVWKTLRTVRPWAVVNAAGYARIEMAEADRASCFRENMQGPATLAEVCADLGIALITFSSAFVFNGQGNRPYVEPDAPMPLNVYGHSKVAGEREVLQIMPDAIIIRTSAFFGPWDESNFLTIALQTVAAGRTFRAAADITVSPTYLPDLVNVALDLLVDGESGIWHLSNGEPVTCAGFAQRAVAAAGMDTRSVKECLLADFEYRAPRPVYSALGSDRGLLLPPLDDALGKYIRERQPASHAHPRVAAC